jgi:hypothetical protein
MKYSYYLLVLLCWMSTSSFGQAVPPGTEIQELVKIADVYANIPNLSFDLKYTYADSLTWHDHTDSMTAACKISYGRSIVTNSQMDVLNGAEYNVYVDKEDSIIMVNRRHDYESIFQLPLLDSVFREAHVLGMSISITDDSTWTFRVTFKPDSYYSFYEMQYNPGNGYIRYVNYHTRNEAGDHNIPADHVICSYLYMTNYSDVSVDPVLFNENRYFYLLNGAVYLQTAWLAFQFQN